MIVFRCIYFLGAALLVGYLIWPNAELMLFFVSGVLAFFGISFSDHPEIREVFPFSPIGVALAYLLPFLLIGIAFQIHKIQSA